MAAGDPNPDASAAADDGQGVAAAARSGMQPSGQAVEGDGNQLLNQVSAGRDLTLGDSVAGDKIAGDKVDGDKVIGDKVSRDKIGRDKFEIVVADAQQAADVARSLRWSWPQPLDFGPYRTFRREGFVGRSWLFEEVRAWAIAEGATAGRPRAQLIEAEYGVGKSAFLAELVDTQAAGIPVVAQHFCQFDAIATLAPGRFVSSIAAQLAAALPAYRAAIEAEDAAGLRQLLEAPDNDPIGAFDQAVLAPLEAIAPPAGPLLLVVDALDEALEHRPSNDKAPHVTIVSLLGQRAQRFPRWLRLLATARPLPAVQQPLRQAFSLHSLNAEEARNLADLEAYAEARCQQPPLASLLAAAGLGASEVAIRLRTLSGGKFLYTAFVLNDLASEALPLRNRADLEALPAGMDDFYLQAFERRFPSEQVYDQVRDLLALHCVQRDPLSRRELAAILSWPEARLLGLQQQLHDLLRLRRNDPAYGSKEFLASFNHPSLSRWLTATDEHSGYPRAGRFSIDPEAAEAAIHRWTLAELEAQRAHTWPYLVRHLASHLSQAERPALLAGLLGEFTWLEARLRLAGINALLGDFSLAAPAPWLRQLGRALGQGAHVLGHSEGWRGPEQLASQLLARLPEENVNPKPTRLRLEAADWLQQAGSAAPRSASLLAPDALLRTFPVGSNVTALVALPDGRLASCSANFGGDSTIRLWDLASGACAAVFEGHQGWVRALAVLADGRLASGSADNTIRLWDPASGACDRVFQGHQGPVSALAVLGDGRLASGSDDNTIRLWDPATGACERVFEGHQSPVNAMAVLADGRLASGSGGWDWHLVREHDNTIRLWDLASGACAAVFEGHQGWVRVLAVLGDGRLAFGSYDNIIRLWDPASGSCKAVFEGHQGGVNALAVLGDGTLASGSYDNTIRLWDPASGVCTAVFEGHGSEVNALAVLADGRLASGSDDKTIKLWDPASGSCTAVFEGHQSRVTALAVLGDGRLASAGIGGGNKILLWDQATGTSEPVFEGHHSPVWALAVLGDGRLASGSRDNTIQLWNIASGAWDPASSTLERVFEGHQDQVWALAVLTDGRLASGSKDGTIRLWDPASGSCTAVFEGHQPWVNALAVLGDGRLATSSEENIIRLWDPASGTRERVFEGHQDPVWALAVLADGRLASGSADNTIRLWVPASGACDRVFQGHQGPVRALAVLGDGRLASGSYDNTIRLWDPAHPDGAPQVLFVADADITALVVHPTLPLLIAGDSSGRLHWLQFLQSP
jgi:WD40 repeat protein